VTFRLLPGQFSVGLNDESHGLLETLSGLLQGVLLNVAAWKLLHVPDPPLAYLLEDTRVTVVLEAFSDDQRACSAFFPDPLLIV
jgi:hypothetical protein